MASFSLLSLCLLSVTRAAAGLQTSADHLVVSTLPRNAITLPCGLPSVRSCSSLNWSAFGEFGSVTELVKAGRLTAPNHRLRLLKDCSLEIHHPVLGDARLYFCGNEALNSSVSLQILQIAENRNPQDNTIELHCYLNTYKGHSHCNNSGIHITWSTEGDTQLNGNRFRFENPTRCLSKLFIQRELTDHHRKWKCQLIQNDMVRASISYTTTVKDGTEEVVAAVGESVSLSCSSTSSLHVSGGVEWTVHGRTLTHGLTPDEGQIKTYHVNKDSSLVISRVSAQHDGDYQCLERGGQQRVLNRISLHTLDVTAEAGLGGDNLTLTCVLTCPTKCENHFSLTWSGGVLSSWQSVLTSDNKVLTNRLFLPASASSSSAEFTCFVHREGDVMATKTWRSVNPLQTPLWLILPVGLLVAAGGLYLCMKRKHNKDAGNERPSIGMSPVYEVIEDADNEGQRQPAQQAPIPLVYDLLQPVNYK